MSIICITSCQSWALIATSIGLLRQQESFPHRVVAGQSLCGMIRLTEHAPGPLIKLASCSLHLQVPALAARGGAAHGPIWAGWAGPQVRGLVGDSFGCRF